MKQTPKLVEEKNELTRVVDVLSKSTLIALDTEFIRESTFYPQIALIQLATKDEVFLLDPLKLHKNDMEPLFELFRDKKILKAIHAAYADQECFYWEYGFTIEPVLDTAVAAAMLGMGDNIGLSKLLLEVLNLNLPKGRARAKWLTRPLPKELLDYAVKDVEYLVHLSEVLIEKLHKTKRFDWAIERSEVLPSEWDESPDDMARRITQNSHLDAKGRGVFLELMKWRETKARSIDLPRNWVASNETLLALAKSRPDEVQDLYSFRGLSKKEIEKSGSQILDCIKNGALNPIEAKRKTQDKQVKSESTKIALLQAYVQMRAEEIGIASRLLLTQDKASMLLRCLEGGKEEWLKKEILDKSAYEMIGQELEELLSGKRAIFFKDGEISVVRPEGK